MLNALTYIGWTLLNGSLLYFGVLNIKNPVTNNMDVFLYPIQDFLSPEIEVPTLPNPIISPGEGPSSTTLVMPTPTPPGNEIPTPPTPKDPKLPTLPTTQQQTEPETTTPQPPTTPKPTTPPTTPEPTTAPTTPEPIKPTTPGEDFSECGVRTAGREQLRGIQNRHMDQYERLLADLRIVGGREAVDGEWPWMVHMYETDLGVVDGGICAATLISSRWIVTAAHCIRTTDPTLYTVMLGEYKKSESSGFEVMRGLTSLHVHPKFNTKTLNNDIAVALLDEEVVFDAYIRPACLVSPGEEYDDHSPHIRYPCTTLGWGSSDPAFKQQSDVLQQLNIQILPQHVCEAITLNQQEAYLSGYVAPGTSKFCAGGTSGEDTCDGDSGGPLICKHDDGKFYIHGITSYGTQTCAQAAKPAIFTKVSDLTVWIQNTTGI